MLFNYIDTTNRKVSNDKKYEGKEQRRKEDLQKDDAPRLRPFQQQSNLEMSPQTSLEVVSQSSPDIKKNQDF